MLPRYQAIGTLVSLAFVIGLLGACAPKPEPPQVGEISVEPSTTILVDESVSLMITALGTDLQFKWTASSGSLSDPTAPSVIYTAPGSSGLVVVTVEVSSEGGTTVQSITLEVVVPEVVVPPTPTPTSTPTSISTPTPTEIPTVAPTPTERPMPTATNMVVLPSPTATPFFCTTSGNGGTEPISVGSQRISGIHIDLIKRALTEDAGFSLWEVEINGPVTGNLALVEGVIATASTWQDAYGCYGCDPSKAIDDDISTRWSSDFMEAQWLEIALPAPRVADHIVLRWEAAYAKEYCVTLIE